METMEDFAQSLSPHQDNAQILLEAEPNEEDSRRIQKILEPIGIDVVRCERISEEKPEWLLLQLSSKDMREAALKLSEAGFKQVRGVNAKRGSRIKKS